MKLDENCEAVRDRIEAFLDHELDDAEHAAVEAHCARCRACMRELSVAMRVRDALHSLPAFAAPAHVIEDAARDASAAKVVPVRGTSQRRRWLPALAAAFAVVAAAVWFTAHERAARAPRFSDAEVRRASAEMALAFGYVEKYSDEAAGIVGNDVLERRVLPCIERALETSREAAVDDGIVPGLKRAAHKSRLDVTSPPPGRS